MRRIASTPRENWQKRVEESGWRWHSGERPYWNECAFYEFSAKEIERLEAATNELEKMTREAARHILDNQLYSRLGIPAGAVPLIERSWKAESPSLYGRFDLAYDGVNPPKLLEYNADTPTALREAAVVQRGWLQDCYPKRDQFNALHEKLVALWKDLALPGGHIDLCSMDDPEDVMTVTYLQDTAQQAGLTTSIFPVEEIGWNGSTFVGPDDQALGTVFKLYPWAWMVREEFGKYLSTVGTVWIEPPWKMLLSNQGLLPVLWTLFPRHPNLLEASFEGPGLMMSWVKKPLLGREGANVTVHRPGKDDVQTGGNFGAEGFIYQELAHPKSFDGAYPVIGSWVIGHAEGNAAGGIGIQESGMPITTNSGQFVPHLVD